MAKAWQPMTPQGNPGASGAATMQTDNASSVAQVQLPPRDENQAGAGPRTEIVVERPPPGLAQGQYAWPAWGVATAGALGVMLAAAYLLFRARRNREASR